MAVEMRWKLGRANKGSPSIPKKLQFRQRPDFYVVPDELEGEEAENYEPPWSDWQDVPTSK